MASKDAELERLRAENQDMRELLKVIRPALAQAHSLADLVVAVDAALEREAV